MEKNPKMKLYEFPLETAREKKLFGDPETIARQPELELNYIIPEKHHTETEADLSLDNASLEVHVQ